MINIKKILFKIIKDYLCKIKIYNYDFIKIFFLKDKKFGNFQIYGLINLKKKLNIKDNIYLKIIENIKININNLNFVEKVFFIKNYINIFLKKVLIENKIKNMLNSKNFNINFDKKKNIVIDYSSPNMAKEMHVGHLRSIILGDSLFRISKFLGHNTFKINHIGDWGINFGMIISEIKEQNIKHISDLSIKELEKLYIKSKKKFEKNNNFKKKSINCFKQLIKKNKNYYNIWKNIINLTIKNNNKIYNLLDVKLNNNDIIGESFYQKFLPNIIKDLKLNKIAFKKNDNIIIPLKKYKNKLGKQMAVIVRKKNNIYPYSIIEIASIRYRCKYLFADRLIYYTDIRQKNHLLQSIEISKMAGYINDKTKFEHHYFGMVLNKNKLPLKTREGNSLKLIDLINKFIEKTEKIIIKKNNFNKNLDINYLKKIIGIGMLKYSSLSKNRLTNYIIDWEKIFSINENKLIHIQYSYARINSIFKKININKISKLIFYKKNFIFLKSKEEIDISLLLLKFEEIIKSIFKNGNINILCLYLYDLSILFSKMYSTKKILSNKNKKSLLNLILLISRIIKTGLNLLGIKIPNKM